MEGSAFFAQVQLAGRGHRRLALGTRQHFEQRWVDRLGHDMTPCRPWRCRMIHRRRAPWQARGPCYTDGVRTLIFAALLVASFGFFSWTIYRLVRYTLLGRPENRMDRLGARLGAVLVYFIGQKK